MEKWETDPNRDPERWEIEGVFDEFKAHLRANSTLLRGKTPELVLREFWGLLLAHLAIRQLMTQAAWTRGIGPRSIELHARSARDQAQACRKLRPISP